MSSSYSSRRPRSHLRASARPSAAVTRPTTGKKKAASPKRRVVFVEARNTVREFLSVDPTDSDLLETLWQQVWEMEECKHHIRVRAKQWRRTGMGVFLNYAYLCDNDLAPALCQEQLNTLSQLPDEFHMRGVERYLCRKHDQDRTNRKRAVVQDIVGQFHTLQAQVSIGTMTQAKADQVLGQFARQLNEDAELFARRIAKADEVAMKKGPAKNIQPAMELMEHLHNLEIERTRKGTTRASSASSSAGSGGPIKSQSTAFSGRRLQARQA